MDKKNALRTLRAYLPALAVAVCTVVTLVLYAQRTPENMDKEEAIRRGTVYFDIVLIGVVALAATFFNRRLRLGIPEYVVFLLCLHMTLSVDFGTALGYYGKFPNWDTFLHTYFGTLAAMLLYYFWFRIRTGKPDFFDHFAIVMIVVAIAGLWEVFEYIVGAILHADMQDAAGLIAAGMSPLYDTVVDMIVATVGALIFEAILLVKWLVLLLWRKGHPLPKAEAAEGEAEGDTPEGQEKTAQEDAPKQN